MKPFFLFFAIIFLFPLYKIGHKLLAQTPGEWTWMHGDNILNSPGTFGTQGAANPSNTPSGFYEACEWKDSNGNFWLYGGFMIGTGMHTALWKYNVATNEWTWMKGPTTVYQPGVFGTQGVPAAVNHPGSRGYGTATWTDLSGNLWLFGGENSGWWNDLWKYTIATNEWTWMKGPSTANGVGSYGIKGVSSPANLPPSRSEISCTWTDNAGNLWLYGGSSSTTASYGDLWKYDISTNEWTWIHGANTLNVPAVYGTQGVSAPANTPGGRWVYCSWTDLSGNLWLFGGGLTNKTNDLWKYDIVLNQWTWMKGPNTANNAGSYGTKCVSANSNVPPARFENRARVRDDCGNFWCFGGIGNNGDFNDLWHYNVSTNQWTWVSGDNITNQAAVNGTKGISSPANKPGIATRGGVAWIDNNGYIWVFGGGGGTDYYNNLFRYVPDPACIPMSAVVTASANTTICAGQNATLTATGGTSYSWSSGETTSSIVVNPTANTTYSVIGTGACGSGSDSVTVIVSSSITASAGPNTTICSGQSATLTASGGGDYSWSTTETTLSITVSPTANATYSVIVSIGSCTDTATASVSVAPGVTANVSGNTVLCTGDAATLTATGGTNYSWSNGTSTNTITVNPTSTTTYTVATSNSSGCTATDTITVNVSAPPIASVANNTIICSGQSATLTATGGGNYSWSNGQSTNSILVTPNGTTNYSVIVSIGTCTDTASAQVIVNPNPTASAASNVTITQGQSTTLSASGGNNYAWNNGDNGTPITVTPNSTTIYCVTVTDANNCADTACVTVTVEPIDCPNGEEIYIPNAFSPNNDGENDFLQVYYGNLTCIKTFKFVIYNRWGEKVFETTDPVLQWDGFYKGQIEGTAVFDYYMEATLISGEEINRKGNMSLVR